MGEKGHIASDAGVTLQRLLFWGSVALLWLTGSPKDTDKAILFGVVAAITPLAAYLLLFRITPWVVRGFKD